MNLIRTWRSSALWRGLAHRAVVAVALVLAAALLLGGAMSGCSGAAKPQTPAKSTSVTIALQGEPTTLDPQYADDGNMRPVTENLFEELLSLNGKTLQVEPSLATAYQRAGDTAWRFTLRQGVKFHNGDVLTADDVVFSVTGSSILRTSPR